MTNELFKDRYRIKSIRLKHWDYSSNGAYFVTVCTKDRIEHFGKIKNGEINLSNIGEIVADEWQKTQQIRKNVELDEWVVMPNHLHGIIIIDNVETPRRGVSTIQKRNPNHKPQWKSKSLGSIINQFKSIATKRIWSIGYHDFQWQARFYESIIRNEKQLNAIREYIINNPSQWKSDENNPKKNLMSKRKIRF